MNYRNSDGELASGFTLPKPAPWCKTWGGNAPNPLLNLLFGDEYLAELICRGLVHGSRLDFDGRPRSCHVYNLMHETIARICED